MSEGWREVLVQNLDTCVGKSIRWVTADHTRTFSVVGVLLSPPAVGNLAPGVERSNRLRIELMVADGDDPEYWWLDPTITVQVLVEQSNLVMRSAP